MPISVHSAGLVARFTPPFDLLRFNVQRRFIVDRKVKDRVGVSVCGGRLVGGWVANGGHAGAMHGDKVGESGR